MSIIGDTDKRVAAIRPKSLWDGASTTNKPVGYSEFLASSTNKGRKLRFGDYAQGMNNMLGSLGAPGGDLFSSLGGWIGDSKYGGFSEEEKAAQSVGRQALSMIPGYGQIIAAATGLVDGIGAATGLNLNSVDADTASRSGVTGTGWNNAINHLPGVSMLFGLFGDRTKNDLTISDSAKELGASGYQSTLKDFNAAESLTNKRLFRSQVDQANNFIDNTRQQERLLFNLNRTNTQRKQSDFYLDEADKEFARQKGLNYLGFTLGKNGMKLMSIEEARRIIAIRKTTEENPEKLQNGGNIPGISSSLLPEGSLHAHKNHLEELNPELEDATKKGIPVMAAKGGEITGQVAEVEDNELVFRLEVTQKLEELMKDGSEEAMIEAGKLIASEVIENTQDNTGQITEEDGNTNSDNK